MPITSKTIKEDPGYSGSSWDKNNKACKSNMHNMAKALAEVTGSKFIEVSYPDDITRISFYVPMAPIGYPGWCVSFETYWQNKTSGEEREIVGIRLFDDSTDTPYLDDQCFTSVTLSSDNGRLSYIGSDQYTETCVMISDANKDTVMFDIHVGITLRGDGLSYTDQRHFQGRYSIFFAKDINDEVLCGVGDSGIAKLRMRNCVLDDGSLTSPTTQRSSDLNDVLHLTKMINYLSAGYPEMKSAYIGIVRPFEDVSTNKRMCLYSLNGVNYGSVGDTDIYLTMRSKQPAPSKYGIYFPFNPIVKY